MVGSFDNIDKKILRALVDARVRDAKSLNARAGFRNCCEIAFDSAVSETTTRRRIKALYWDTVLLTRQRAGVGMVYRIRNPVDAGSWL